MSLLSPAQQLPAFFLFSAWSCFVFGGNEGRLHQMVGGKFRYLSVILYRPLNYMERVFNKTTDKLAPRE